MKKVLSISQIIIILLITALLIVSLIVRTDILYEDVTDLEQLAKNLKFIASWSKLEFPLFGVLTLFLIMINERRSCIAEVFTEKETENSSISQEMTTLTPKQVSSVDNELLKYKLLLNDGIITQEDFEQKKRQLLGL